MTTLQGWLREAPFTLTLSAGFFGFFAHAGMLSALLEAGVQPRRVTGSSAGALVGACWASGTSMLRTREVLLALERRDFWDPRPGLGLLKGRKFRRLLGEVLGQETFETCPVPLSVSAYDILAAKTVSLERGLLVPAIYASCAFPGLFQPIRVGGRWLSDGGIADRPGLHSVPEGERTLYHHLGSRSPWRRRSSKALKVPDREGLAVLTLDGLPRVSPTRLRLGSQAFETALEGTRVALGGPVVLA